MAEPHALSNEVSAFIYTRVSFILMFDLVAPKEWPICIYYAIS